VGVYTEICQKNLILVCNGEYIQEASIKIHFFSKNSSLYDTPVQDKYRTHYDVQLLLETFYIKCIFNEIQGKIIYDSMKNDT
jgi:hypothetical protein